MRAFIVRAFYDIWKWVCWAQRNMFLLAGHGKDTMFMVADADNPDNYRLVGFFDVIPEELPTYRLVFSYAAFYDYFFQNFSHRNWKSLGSSCHEEEGVGARAAFRGLPKCRWGEWEVSTGWRRTGKLLWNGATFLGKSHCSCSHPWFQSKFRRLLFLNKISHNKNLTSFSSITEKTSLKWNFWNKLRKVSLSRHLKRRSVAIQESRSSILRGTISLLLLPLLLSGDIRSRLVNSGCLEG